MADSFNPPLNRKSTRLAGFDYTQDRAYFITIVTQWRACPFGDNLAGEMRLDAAGAVRSALPGMAYLNSCQIV
jgi:hypothetical protein